MSYGYPYILNVDGCIHDGWLAFSDFDDYFDIDFLYFVLLSPFCKTQFTNTAAGAVVKNLNINKVRKILVPVPPIAEQKRITKKLERLFDDVEQAEKSFFDLQNLSNFLRKIILQQAIHGKLVPQLESEPSVKIETTTKLDEVPFTIPDKWKWVSLGDIAEQITDGEHKTPKYQDAGIPFISVKDISSGKLNLSNTKFVSKEDFALMKRRCHPQMGDILLSKVGTTGVPAIVDTKQEFGLFVSVALIKPKKDLVQNVFLWYLLQTPLVQKQAKDNTRGIGNKNWVLKSIKDTIIPLPPLLEQKRIACKLSNVLKHINAI